MNRIRLFDSMDVESIYDIYAYYVKNSTAIFDLAPMDKEVFKNKMLDTSEEYPFYVAEHDGELIGYAYVHKAFTKEAYRFCVELSIYFKKGNHYGMADALLKKVEEACIQKGYKWIIACITDTNTTSINFHLKHGYVKTGSLQNCGYKWNQWHGVNWLCKDLISLNIESYYKASSAIVDGDVKIAKDVSIWHGAVIRADSASVEIDEGTNVQDMALIHVDKDHPVKIGKRVTIGHKAIVHGATIEDDVLIGMSALVMNGAVIKKGSIVGAGALVKENMIVPEGSVVVGMPAKVIKQTNSDQIQMIKENADHYIELAKQSLNKV